MGERALRIRRRVALTAPAVVVLGVGGGLPLAGGGATVDERPATRGVVQIQLLGVNDFHGTLESPGRARRGRGEVPLGGAAVLAAHLDEAAASAPQRTIRVHAGDMVGASPLISSHFHGEPSVKAMNLMDFDVGTVGNHEIEGGADEMLRLLRGGRRRGPAALKRDERGAPVNTSDPGFAGVDFPYVAANTVYRRSGELLLPPYRIVERAGVRIGFIGVTTESTPTFLLGRHSSGLRFLDISETVDRYVAELRGRGVEAIVVLAHSGAFETEGREAAVGEIVDETREMSEAVDVVIAGHSHSELNLRVDGKLVVEAMSYGTAYDKVDLTVDRASGDVVASSAEIPRTWRDRVHPDPQTAALVREHADLVAPLAERVLGAAVADIDRGPAAAESWSRSLRTRSATRPRPTSGW